MRRIDAEPRLERLAPAPLNVVCFRFRVAGLTEPALDALNQSLLVELQESGVAVPAQTILDGRFALRVALTNHRTRIADLELFLAEALRRGEALARRAARQESLNPSAPEPA